MKFKSGDLVLITDTEHRGSVTTIESVCACIVAMMSVSLTGVPIYRLTGFPDCCFRETSLKKVGGERPKESVDETRDAPVEA